MKKWYDEEYEFEIEVIGFLRGGHTERYCRNGEEVGDRYTCTYATGDAKIAAVDEKGVVTAVGPGTTTITMTVDGGGTEYIFECIVRCKWTESE